MVQNSIPISLSSTKEDCQKEMAQCFRSALVVFGLDPKSLTNDRVLALFRSMERERDRIAANAGYFQGEI